MKNALLTYKLYKDKFNIGDYIQSISAEQFLLNIDIYLNRDYLDEYKGEKVKIILNGWFLHEKEHWPPSNYIEPIFISFHLNSSSYYILENKLSIDYFKKYQPIGCRDKDTMRLLIEKGIKAYFSGCLTLTLGETYKRNNKSDKIFFVDPFIEIKTDIHSISNYIFVFIYNYKRIINMCKSMSKSISIRSLIKSLVFYNSYIQIFEPKVLETAIYTRHVLKESDFSCEEDKFYFARTLLYKYSSAKFVVTSRIHCALPCLGMETPVLYVENINQLLSSSCRLDGLRELLHIITFNKGKMKLPDDLGTRKITMNTKIVNKKNYLYLKENLISKCNAFFNL